MARFKSLFSKITVRQECDKLIVAILDGNNELYFKGAANVNNKKELNKLKEDLRFKGVDI